MLHRISELQKWARNENVAKNGRLQKKNMQLVHLRLQVAVRGAEVGHGLVRGRDVKTSFIEI